MTAIAQNLFKCNRCSARMVLPANQYPPGWQKLFETSIEDLPGAIDEVGDLCDTCHDSFVDWFRQPSKITPPVVRQLVDDDSPTMEVYGGHNARPINELGQEIVVAADADVVKP